MPFYGDVDQFQTAVRSVLAQTSGDWRLTIVDDVYPDPAPGEWARALDDPRVRYLRNESNLGVAGNFQRCVELMSETHAVIMGGDDVMLPGFVERVHELVAAYPEADIIQPGVGVIDSSGSAARPLPDRVKELYRPRGPRPRELAGEELAASLLRGNWAYFPSLVWRTATITEIGFRPDLRVALDLALLLQIVARGGRLVLDDRVVFLYRRHLASVSSFSATDGSRFIEERDVLWEAADTFAAMGWARAARIGRRYLSSRLNALSVFPRALRSATADDRRVLLDHILGRPQR